MLGDHIANLPEASQHTLTGLDFFPHLISDPFADGLSSAFTFAIVCCIIGAIASLFTGGRKSATETAEVETRSESLGAELAAVAADASMEAPSELIDEPQINEPQINEPLSVRGR